MGEPAWRIIPYFSVQLITIKESRTDDYNLGHENLPLRVGDAEGLYALQMSYPRTRSGDHEIGPFPIGLAIAM